MKAKTTGSILIVALAAAVVVALCCLRSVSVEAVYPVERAKVGFCRGLRTRVRAWFNAQQAARENARLRREVASLALAFGDVDRLETENARLRRALDYVAKNPECWIAAEVLSAGGAAAGTSMALRIGKGSADGIAVGAAVVVPEGLVGRVVSVTPHTAQVSPITDSAVHVACEIEAPNAPRMRGILSGPRSGALVLKYLKHVAETPPPCARVVTSGLGGVFPGGLVIGTLQSVQRDEAGHATEADILPAVDFESLEDVFIRHEK